MKKKAKVEHDKWHYKYAKVLDIIGLNLRLSRIERDLTLEQCSSISGLSASGIQRAETSNGVSLSVQCRLLQFYVKNRLGSFNEHPGECVHPFLQLIFPKSNPVWKDPDFIAILDKAAAYEVDPEE